MVHQWRDGGRDGRIDRQTDKSSKLKERKVVIKTFCQDLNHNISIVITREELES